MPRNLERSSNNNDEDWFVNAVIFNRNLHKGVIVDLLDRLEQYFHKNQTTMDVSDPIQETTCLDSMDCGCTFRGINGLVHNLTHGHVEFHRLRNFTFVVRH